MYVLQYFTGDDSTRIAGMLHGDHISVMMHSVARVSRVFLHNVIYHDCKQKAINQKQLGRVDAYVLL